MKILMANYEFPPIGGGAGNAHLCLLKEYACIDDLEVDVLTSAPKPGFTIEKFSRNITIYKVGLHKKDLHFWRKIEVIEWLLKAEFHYRGLLRQNHYDLAHAFFAFPTAWLCYRYAARLPYIISLRGSDVPGLNPRLALDYKLLAPVFRQIWKNAVAIVACSEGLRKRALQFLSTVDIDVIPNGVDISRFSQSHPRDNLQIFRLLTVGRLSASKRIELLIAAVAQMNKKYPGITLTIAGGGGLQENLRKIVEQSRLQGIVRILGWIPSWKMPQLYQQHDLFVSATAQEGMSNAMLEAMASGLPVVTTACEGTDELITDNGIVVNDAEPSAIEHEILALFHDHQKYIRMCAASRIKASAFRWERLAGEYLETCRRAI
ncbi:MAG: glycosyltransferase family 4 protein [Planctomycetota bacterium]